MRIGDLLGQGQKINLGTNQPLSVLDHIAAQGRVGFHDGHFIGIKPAGLEQNPVRDANFANVMQRRRPKQQVDVAVGQKSGKAGVLLQLPAQRPHIVLGAPDVVAGFVVAGFRQCGQRGDGHILRGRDLL